MTENQLNRFARVASFVYFLSIFSHAMIAILGWIMDEMPIFIYFTCATALYTFLYLIKSHRLIAWSAWLALAEVCAVIWFLMQFYQAGLGVASLVLFILATIFFLPFRDIIKFSAWLIAVGYLTYLVVHFDLIQVTGIYWAIEYGGLLISAIFMGILAYYYNRIAALAEVALEAEHEKSEQLLHNAMPETIVSRLKKNEVIADQMESATIVFADMVGFTQLASRLSAKQVVQKLDDLFRRFDRLVSECEMEKIKTIGDAYMAAAGVPIVCGDHAQRSIRLAKKMFIELDLFNQENHDKGSNPLNLRIGIGSGPILAGVIGEKRWAYDLWGDTVNMAARMESHGVAGKIQVSRQTWELAQNDFEFEKRGSVTIKGKGEMDTWFVL